MPLGPLLLYLLASIAMALCYGSTFLLADALTEAGFAAAQAGMVIGLGTVATLLGAVLAGRWAKRLGILPLVACAAVVMALALLCFAAIGAWGLVAACTGGLLLGLGWAVFYMLAPIQLIQCLQPSARLEALTLLSGAQMLGMGLAAPLGRLLAKHGGGLNAAFFVYALLCGAAGLAVLVVHRCLRNQAQLPLDAVALTWQAVLGVLRSRVALPVAMIGVAACTFAGLTTFQSLYAQSRGVTPDAFFITFTATTVVLRFAMASHIGRLPPRRLVLVLFALIVGGIALLLWNRGSMALYVAASFLFATGYGLTYATLNAMAVNVAQACGLPVPIASQVFTLGYFVGVFGFPYVAGVLIAASGVNSALFMMLALMGLNLALALKVPKA